MMLCASNFRNGSGSSAALRSWLADATFPRWTPRPSWTPSWRREMTRMALTAKCPLCGEVLSGDEEDGLVASADKHGDERQNGMKAPRAMVLGAARKSE
jgi:hypothetical protein